MDHGKSYIFWTAFRFLFPKFIFSKYIFAKCTFLTHLLLCQRKHVTVHLKPKTPLKNQQMYRSKQCKIFLATKSKFGFLLLFLWVKQHECVLEFRAKLQLSNSTSHYVGQRNAKEEFINKMFNELSFKTLSLTFLESVYPTSKIIVVLYFQKFNFGILNVNKETPHTSTDTLLQQFQIKSKF